MDLSLFCVTADAPLLLPDPQLASPLDHRRADPILTDSNVLSSLVRLGQRRG
jgi:hypothetical protein